MGVIVNVFSQYKNREDSSTPMVFLGGTYNGSDWRDRVISFLEYRYFNPILPDNVEWNEDAQKNENIAKLNSDYLLYTITPEMTGVYSIAEVVDDSNKNPDKTILCILEEYGGLSFAKSQMKSLKAVADLVANNGAVVFYNLDDTIKYLNDSCAKLLERINLQKEDGI